MNFLFISPNYPSTYFKFCRFLKERGYNVLGIGDEQPERLSDELREVLSEYVHVDDMNNYGFVLDAARYLSDKFGGLCGLESNNEFWLEHDAMLRRDLDIREGVRGDLLKFYQYKSKMKTKFAAAGVPCVPFCVTRKFKDAKAFSAEYGYPIFTKPNRGVGARAVHKFAGEGELADFFATEGAGDLSENFTDKSAGKASEFPARELCEDYIFEVYIEGDLFSFDGLTDRRGTIVFEAAHRFETPIHKLKITDNECVYYTLKSPPDKLAAAGRAAVAAFKLKNRFFHIEFFKLSRAIAGVGAVGDFAAVEVNMRPAGGFTPEMINAAKEINVYDLWAQCISAPSVAPQTVAETHFCVNIGRHRRKNYKNSVEDMYKKFPHNIVFSGQSSGEDNPFGNFEIIGKFKTFKECRNFASSATAVE